MAFRFFKFSPKSALLAFFSFFLLRSRRSLSLRRIAISSEADEDEDAPAASDVPSSSSSVHDEELEATDASKILKIVLPLTFLFLHECISLRPCVLLTLSHILYCSSQDLKAVYDRKSFLFCYGTFLSVVFTFWLTVELVSKQNRNSNSFTYILLL